MKLAGWLTLLLLMLAAQNIWAMGACTCGRFNDWQDNGCNRNHPGAGGTQGGTDPCPCKNKTHGMPEWWVHEPYENLWMSDMPLSYQTSSGQEMAFKLFYRQRFKVPDPDEVPGYWLGGVEPRYDNTDDYYAPVGPASRMQGMTNAAWANNWQMSVVFWDAQWESKYTDPTYQSIHPVFSDSYEAFVFQPEGGIDYFYNTNEQSSLQEPRSQVRLQPLSATNYPVVSLPTPDTNGIYWGSATNGFVLNYPDGSQDVFGLTHYDFPMPDSPYRPDSTITTAESLLTQRIDPQGRVTKLGYEKLTNGYAFRVKYVVDPDGRTNTLIYASYSGFYNYTPPNPFALKEVDDPTGGRRSSVMTLTAAC